MNPQGLLDTESKDKWQRISIKRRSGALVPLFSVYSKNSIGIGDLADLRLLIDWAGITGNSIIQLLPMNELGSVFCPYDSVSSFALEPMYICLRDLSGSKDHSISKKIESLKKRFPAGEKYVNYSLKREKLQLLREIYALNREEDSGDFKEFKAQNSYWLLDFALFKVIKQDFAGRPWYDWDEVFKNRGKSALEAFQEKHSEEISFQIWLQWQLYKQFKSVKGYAASKNILLKGDLPILVSRDSADAWVHPEFFKLDFVAGAPPDMYCAKGQRWGMSPYNWEKVSADDFNYLAEKLKYAQEFYDLLRVDHVIGLFRFWSILYGDSPENKGLNGAFDPSDENTWEENGRSRLSAMLKKTRMLLCAEDLGVIPVVCPAVLKELGIPGNNVQRWVKDWDGSYDFLKPRGYREVAVAMLSTHDTTNWPAWWENEAATVDEALFISKCSGRGIDYDAVKDKLFDFSKSAHGRLRWNNDVSSVDILIGILGKDKGEVADFITMYQDTFREKEKLWKQLKLRGPMREKSDPEIVRAALGICLESSAIFCINTIFDYLYLGKVLKGDPYEYRINTPGTISGKNWSLVVPVPLEELLKQEINKDIRAMIVSSGRH